MASAHKTRSGGSRLTRPFIRLSRYLQEVWAELQRVVWPSKQETYALTLVVIVAVLVVAAYMSVLDLVASVVTRGLGLLR